MLRHIAHFIDVFTHLVLFYSSISEQGYSFSDSVADVAILSLVRVSTKWNVFVVKLCVGYTFIKILSRILDIDSTGSDEVVLSRLLLSILATVILLLPLDRLRLPNRASEADRLLLPQDEQQSSVITYYSMMFSLLKSELPLTIFGCCVNAIRLPFSMSLPYWISCAFGALIKHDADQLYHYTIYCFACGTVDSILDFWCVFIFALIQTRISSKLRSSLFSKIVTQPMSFFDVTPSGELLSRLTSDTEETSNQMSWNCRFFIEAVIRVSGVSILLFISSWRLATLTCCLIPLNSFIAQQYGLWSAKNSRRAQDALAHANAFAQEAVSAVGTVKAFGAESKTINLYSGFLDKYFTFQLREAAVRGGYYMIVYSFMMTTVAQAALLGYGGFLVLRGHIAAETLVSFILYRGQLQDYCNSILDTYASTLRSAGAGSKIIGILNQPSERVNGDTSAGGLIEFERVSFTYPCRPSVQVLCDVSFIVKPGQVVCLVGQSGSGKTSLLALLQGLYVADSGDVRVGGVSVSGIDLTCLRRRLTAVVAQEPVLFKGTIRENILYGIDTQVDDARIDKALEISCSTEFVSRLPGGLDCTIGERGVQLSGGQKQRLAIARAVMMDPAILLLDEATSSLDAEAEQTVQQALENSMRGRTTIMISHKLSTAIKYADWIVVIGKGAVIEQGTPKQLLAHSDSTNPLSLGSLLKMQG